MLQVVKKSKLKFGKTAVEGRKHRGNRETEQPDDRAVVCEAHQRCLHSGEDNCRRPGLGLGLGKDNIN